MSHSATTPPPQHGVDAPTASSPAVPADPLAHLRFWPEGVPRGIDPGPDTLWQVYAARAAAEPDAVGLRYLGRDWTWRELVVQAAHLAGALQARGVIRGDRVLLFMQNCPQFVMAFHAVLACGAVVVPVNPMNKADELPHYIADAGARVAFASSDIAAELARASDSLPAGHGLAHLVVFDLAEALPAGASHAAALAGLPAAWRTWLPVRHPAPALAHGQVDGWSAWIDEARTPDAVHVNSTDLALLPYTSGTTGQPKGCLHTHATLSYNAAASGPWHDVRPGDVELIVVPMFHITGLVMGLLASIRHGASIVLLPRWDHDLAARTIAAHGVTHWHNIPTMVIDLLGAPNLERYDLSSLRYIGGGGAAMPETVAARLFAQYGLRYVEGYGLTETAAPTHSNPRQAPRRACLGIPWVGTEARVVDVQTLAPLPVNEVGEILVRGPQVFHGYWNQPAATEAAFVEIEGRRFFRTGDLGRVDADGYYTIADRLKRMINASGFKVWPAEVEALLYAHPAVQEVCIIARRDAYRGETVKAVIVPRDSHRSTVTARQIIDWSREHMAVYKAPREVEFVDVLPRTASGKVLWRAVQAREDERPSPPAAH